MKKLTSLTTTTLTRAVASALFFSAPVLFGQDQKAQNKNNSASAGQTSRTEPAKPDQSKNASTGARHTGTTAPRPDGRNPNDMRPNAPRSASATMADVTASNNQSGPPVEAIRQALATDTSHTTRGVEVEEKSGKIILRGTVPSRQVKREVEKTAQAAARGMKIENQLKVTPEKK